MDKRWQRLTLLWSEEQVNMLLGKTVMVVGIGGVGAMAAEALARSAVGHLVLIDQDEVEITNLNRQILSTSDNIGRAKVEVMKERILSIHPNCNVTVYPEFFDKNNLKPFEENDIDFVVDAIDTISCKLDLIELCQKKNIPVISCLGMGNRVDPSQLMYTTLKKTENDPLARSMRAQARKRNISLEIPVVFSKEQPVVTQSQIVNEDGSTQKSKTPPASSPFVPNAAGLLCAAYAVNTLLHSETKDLQ